MTTINRRPKRGLDTDDVRSFTLTVKISPNEFNEIVKRAEEHAGGKRADFIRAALLGYKPRKSDFS